MPTRLNNRGHLPLQIETSCLENVEKVISAHGRHIRQSTAARTTS